MEQKEDKKRRRCISIEDSVWDAGVAEAARQHKTMTQLIREYLARFTPENINSQSK